LITKHSDLAKELKKLRIELAAYSEQDPVEVEKKAHEIRSTAWRAGSRIWVAAIQQT
jgi:cell division septum initiation protein DivIVA